MAGDSSQIWLTEYETEVTTEIDLGLNFTIKNFPVLYYLISLIEFIRTRNSMVLYCNEC